MNSKISIELQDIIKNISFLDINIYESRSHLLEKIQYLLGLKLKLNSMKPNSRFSNNPSLKELFKIERKLIIEMDFHERNFSDPIKWAMAITPTILVSMMVGTILGFFGLGLYAISYFY
tara:strand:- start:249 stop:605 length:357 start_codon:yes stop_codon:yes gene_type:complete